MTKKNILIVCAADPQRNPRPNRMIRWLKDEHNVTVIGQNQIQMDGIESDGFSNVSSETKSVSEKQAEKKWKTVLAMRYPKVFYILGSVKFFGEALLQTPAKRISFELEGTKALRAAMKSRRFDLIISHDLSLLPFVWDIKSADTKILLDAREYYPRNYDDEWRWRLLEKRFNTYLCKNYLKRCDKVITVSEGLAQEYAREFRVEPEVIMSMPDYQAIQPVESKTDKVRLIYHGHAGHSRRTEVMIEMMDYLDDRFSLDLMLMETQDAYWQKIVTMTAERKNVKIIPPVPMNEIIRFTNRYDIGLFLVPPTNFNLTYTLPNKFFEFIQARLAIAIGPSIEMKRLVEKYDCGVVSRDFDPRSLAEELNKLTVEEIMKYKGNSHKAAGELNAEVNKKRMMQILDELTDGKS